MEGGAMNTCLRMLKETKWILSFYQNSLRIPRLPFGIVAYAFTLFWTTFVETAVYNFVRNVFLHDQGENKACCCLLVVDSILRHILRQFQFFSIIRN